MTAETQTFLDWTVYLPDDAPQQIRFLHDYWESKKTTTSDLPNRTDIHPHEMIPVLQNLWLLGLDDDTRTWRYRLIGTAVVDGAGRDCTGRTLSEAHDGSPASHSVTAALHWLSTFRRPLRRRGVPLLDHPAAVRRLESIMLPLTTDGRTLDRILGMSLFYDGQGLPYRPGARRTR